MAEQAQRRAPLGQPPETPKDDSQQFEELRHLIVAPEQEGIAEISHRLDNLERRAEDVSSVVVEAIELRRQQDTDGALAAALGPTIEDTLRESVRKHPHILADALFPVMGPAIRKSITETLRSMLESFNEALEHSLSWRGIKWRIEALRTDKSFAEIVVMHSLLYRVEEVFLIHRETGLVLNHLTDPSLPQKDGDMLAGMLNALQQLSRDRFNTADGDALQKWEMPELVGWLEVGPRAVIAVVIRGHAPEDYRLRMKVALEGIETQFTDALQNFANDAGPFRAAEERLAPLLESRSRDAEPAASRKGPRALISIAALILLALIGWISYVTYEVRQWTSFANGLKGRSGIVVTSYSKENGKYQFQGFRDPLAEDPAVLAAQAGFTAKDAEFHLKPFYSTEDAMVLKRAKLLLVPPAGVKLSMKDGKLTAEGDASPQWIARFQDRAGWIAGVTEVDASHLQNGAAATLEHTKAIIEGIIFVFPLGRADLEPGQDALLAHTETDFGNLLAEAASAHASVRVEVIGHTDSAGVEATNLPLSKQRADVLTSLLLHAGVKATAFQPRGVGTSQPLRSEDTEEGRHFNRSVTFHVDITPASPAN